MNQEIIKSISNAVDSLILNSTKETKLKSIIDKHKNKVHFIPIKYRVLGGILQSMNIQFGNFLETTIRNIIALNKDNEILEKFSGKKSNKFKASKKSIDLIDKYILSCQNNINNDKTLTKNYNNLLNNIINAEQEEQEIVTFNHDIDLLFKQKEKDIIVYVEIKYNDDHDTGKFVDINKKFLYTIALLIREYNITDINKIKPVLMYFNNKRMKGNNYLPEDTTIYRGERFFNTFTTIKYSEIDDVFKNISESPELNKKFDELCYNILNIKY